MAGKYDRPLESLLPLSDKFLAKLIAGPFSTGFEGLVALVKVNDSATSLA
jgi:hypothetical protein